MSSVSRELYDPRKQALVMLAYRTGQPQLTASRSFELSQIYGSVRSSSARPAGSLNSTGTKPAAGPSKTDTAHFSRQRTELESKVHPPFLTRNARWEQQALPMKVNETQGQPLTATGNLDGTRGLVQAPRAISAVHSYNDMSPVLTTEFVRDSDKQEVSWEPTINERGAVGVYQPEQTQPPSRVQTMVASLRPTEKTRPQTAAHGNMATRKASVDAFFHQTGSGAGLKDHDIHRMASESLGKHVVPGNANAKLVGGRWRYLDRPVEGKPLYTDYYGRFDSSHCNFYGRTYHYLPQ